MLGPAEFFAKIYEILHKVRCENFGTLSLLNRLNHFDQILYKYSTTQLDELITLYKVIRQGQGRYKVIYLSELLWWAETST